MNVLQAVLGTTADRLGEGNLKRGVLWMGLEMKERVKDKKDHEKQKR